MALAELINVKNFYPCLVGLSCHQTIVHAVFALSEDIVHICPNTVINQVEHSLSKDPTKFEIALKAMGSSKNSNWMAEVDSSIGNPIQRIRPKRCLGGFIFTQIINNK